MGIRKFESGATRDTNEGKYEYARHLDSRTLRRYIAYMHAHRRQSDGSLREPDNWKKGMGDTYIDSLLRHTMDVWEIEQWGSALDHRTNQPIDLEEALCGVIFNAFGKLYEVLKAKQQVVVETAPAAPRTSTEKP